MDKTNHTDIKQILPHRSPMLLIHKYRKIDKDTATAFVQLTPDSYACADGWISPGMLIDAMAQTVAAHLGYEALENNDKEPAPGMLTNVDEFEVHEKIKDTSLIEIKTVKTDEIGPFKLISGKMKICGKLVAAGRIKVFNPKIQAS